MKKYIYSIFCLLGLFFMGSCSDDDFDMSPGNPVMDVKTYSNPVFFGDSLSFTVGVSDHVPLSTLTATLYFGDEQVTQTVIRTKSDGDYSGKVFVPFLKDIPNGMATLEFTLMDTHLTSTTKSFDVPVSRASYPYLILVTADASYPMLPTGNSNEYAATEAFPSIDLPAYIKTPVIDDKGNEITFGWEDGQITQGVTGNIPFMSPQAGTYSVTFNTKTYEAGPFFEIFINEQQMGMVDKENFKADLDLTTGQKLTIQGISDIADWWIDPDFFTRESGNELKFVPVSGKYRIIANTTLKYLRVEVMSGNSLATLKEDGTGAIWVIGEKIGKPSVSANEVTWKPENALCMVPMGDKKYRISFVGGQTINTDAINFKFYHQKDWTGGEFKNTSISTTSDLVRIRDDENNYGNLAIISGKTLEEGATYVFIVDVSGGNDHAVLTVTKK